MNAPVNHPHAVFLAGNQLPPRWQGRDSFAILASDFGDGLAFLSTWHAWQCDPQRSQRLHYLVFASPQRPSVVLHATVPPELQPLLDELIAHWPLPIHGFHRIHLHDGRVMLTLMFGAIKPLLTEVTGPIDAFYLMHDEAHFDNENPDWALPQFKQLWRLCKADSTLVSQSLDTELQLHAAGFQVVTQTQSPTQYLQAHCRRAPKSMTALSTKQAVILGAGMAGCAAAASLASRGWEITLIDAQTTIASQASGNHIGLCHPVLSRDDNFQARLSRAGFFTTQQKLTALRKAQQPVQFAADGHLQIAKDAAAAQLMQAILVEQQLPSTLVTWLGAADCKQALNIEYEWGGWWFPQGMWINPVSLCNGYIDPSINHIDLQLNTHIHSIKRIEQHWHLYDRNEQLITRTEILILANATDALRLLPDMDLPLSASLRSVTRLPAAQINASPHNLSGLTYLTAAFAGWRCAGASLVNAGDDCAEQNNLKDLAKLIGANAVTSTEHAETRLCFRPNSSDRLPLVGALPDTSDIQYSVHQLFHIPRVAGLYGILGFGSRGLTWHALAAEVLACQLNGEPQGLERSLIAAIDPARFALRQLRKKTSFAPR